MHTFTRTLVLLTVLSGLAGTSSGQPANSARGPRNKPTYTKLASRLSELAEMETDSVRQKAAVSENRLSEGLFVPVTIRVTSNNGEAHGFVVAQGGRVANENADVLEAYLPVAALAALDSVRSVVRVEEILPEQPRVVSQGASIHGAANWNAAGLAGQGVKVGIIDSDLR
jgi:hypothetical protein